MNKRAWVRRTGVAGIALLAAGGLATQLLRAADRREADHAWLALQGRSGGEAERFDPAMVEALPEPARRFFHFSVAPGTPLRTTAIVEMRGRFGLGDRDSHSFYPMEARQILAPPHGFVWTPQVGSGVMRMSGSDGLVNDRGWTRFWLLGVAPIVRSAGAGDIARSAAGRLIGESVWTPAALLPRSGVQWEPAGQNSARFTMRIAGERHSALLTVDEVGRPMSIVLSRWSNANPEKVFRRQPFGATFDSWRTFEGFAVPTRVNGGNHFGGEDYFPFFQAEVTDISYR